MTEMPKKTFLTLYQQAPFKVHDGETGEDIEITGAENLKELKSVELTPEELELMKNQLNIIINLNKRGDMNTCEIKEVKALLKKLNEVNV